MPHLKSLCTIAASAALAVSAASCGGTDNAATAAAGASGKSSSDLSKEAAMQIVGGTTLLKLDPTVHRVLDAAGVKVTPVGQAKSVAGGIELPVVTGRLDVDTPSGTIQHGGGIRFSVAGHDLTATNLLLRPGKGEVTARVDGQRVPFIETALGHIKVQGNTVLVPNQAKVGQGLVRGLNQAAGMKLLAGGLTLGTFTTRAKRGR